MDRILDDPATIEKCDPTGMIRWIEDFHEQCAEGVSIARAFDLPDIQDIQNVVVCGMGGSAIGGDLMRSYASSYARAPIEVVRSYQLPRYANENTLLVASSYSGNTEETLSAYEQAKACGAKILGISTGGQLAERCQQDGRPCIITKGGMSPRAALGYSFMPLLVSLERLGLIENQSQAIGSALAVLKESKQQHGYDSPFENNFAKQIAKEQYGSIPVIYAGQNAFEPIAARWRAQINENAKTFAHNMVVPEMNHNEILGWKNPKPSVLKKLHIVYLLDEGYHPQTLRRFEVMKQIIEPYAHGVTTVQSKGNSLLARMLYTISVGDFASCYLAYFYKEDPTPIPAIDFLKAELAKA